MTELTARFVARTNIGENTFELVFELPENALSFSAGQYIWLVLAKLDFPDPRGERRAFSITSSPQDTRRLTVQYRDSDSGFKKTLAGMAPGTEVRILGPFGSSYVPTPEQQKIVMIAGGVGNAPFMSIVRSIDYQEQPRFSFIYVNGTPQSGVHVDELHKLSVEKNLPFVNHVGLFTEAVLPLDLNYATDCFYICGPIGMVDAVYQILNSKGVPFTHMHFEQHYPTPEGNLTEADFIEKPGEHNIMLQAVHNSKNHVVITDANGQIIFANITAVHNTGFSFDEMRGHTPRLWGGRMSVEFYKDFWHKKQQAGGLDGEIVNRRKNGEIYRVIAHISPIKNASGIVVGYIGTEEDITRITSLETQLLQDRQRDEALLLSLGEGVVANDKNGSIIFINQAALDMLRYDSQDLLGKSFVNLIQAEQSDGTPITPMERPIAKASYTKQPIRDQLVYIRKDGTKFESAVIVTPVYVHGEYFGSVQVFNDNTQEKLVDKAKSEFISLASHQLRTPLSTINWYCEMLLAGDAGPINDEQKKFLEEAYGGSQRLARLVNALLNVSRIETGSFMVEPENVDVVKLTRSVLDESKPMIDDKKIMVTLEKEAIPEIMLDPNLAVMIFQNLLTNAVKYTPENGKVTVFLRVVNKGTSVDDHEVQTDSLVIQVTDTGMGIPKEQQSEVFKKMFRADNARKSETEGTGLGLYLIKSLIEHSRGEIWFESEENKGTTFYVILPLSGMEKKDGDKRLSA